MWSEVIEIKPKYVTELVEFELNEKSKKNILGDAAREETKFKLHAAIKRNDNKAVEGLIAKGLDVDELDERGDAPFVTAIRINNVEALKILIKARCDLTNLDGLNSSSLGLASIYGHVDCVSALIDAGEDLDEATYFSHNSLMLAVFQGSYDVVKILLERGADPNWINRHSMTALHKSLMIIDHHDEPTRHKIVAGLLRYGADPCQTIINDDVFSSFLLLGRACPLSFAVATGYISLIRMLLLAGHDVIPSDLDKWKERSLLNNISQAFYCSPEVTDPILECITNPRSLLQLSRTVIRKTLPAPLPKTVRKLEALIGRDLTDYLNFSDFDSIKCEPATNRGDILSAYPSEINQMENNTLRLLKLISR